MKYLRAVTLLVISTLLILGAFLVPSHLRAVDSEVIRRAGSGTPSLVDAGLRLLRFERIGPARLLARAAQTSKIPGWERLDAAVRSFARANPDLALWGGADPYLPRILKKPAAHDPLDGKPVIELLLPSDARTEVASVLAQSKRPGVHEMLNHRQWKRTTLFPNAQSSAGHPLDAAILVTALLFQSDRFAPSLRDELELLATRANHGESTQPMETFYLDILSLGKRLNWMQLIEFIRGIDRRSTLHEITTLIRQPDTDLPTVFAGLSFAETPSQLVEYVKKFGQSGLGDLAFSIRSGRGAVRELLARNERIYYPAHRAQLAERIPFNFAFATFIDVARYAPGMAVTFKYLFLALGGFLLARAVTGFRPELSARDRTLVVKGFDTIRQMLFALALLLCLLVFLEPFLAQENQTRTLSMRFALPASAQAVRNAISNQLQSIMDQLTILALALFFVVQCIIYVVGLLKLAEIKRQPIPSQLKIKLLENEENLFDAGLYCGLGGTVGSLVFLAMGVIKPSLMAAYSSTLFGLLFVAALKIFHLRPYRRSLILDAETRAHE